MKIGIIGSRKFKNLEKVEKWINEFGKIRELNNIHREDMLFISGGAKGVNQYAIKVADALHYKTKVIEPDYTDWDLLSYHQMCERYYARNRKIVEESDKIVAFWDGKSGGTRYTINYAIEMGKCLNIIVEN